MRHEPQRRSPIERCPTSRYIWTERDEDEDKDEVDDRVDSSRRDEVSWSPRVGTVQETEMGWDGDKGAAEALGAEVSSAPMGESAVVHRGRGMDGDDASATRGAACSGEATATPSGVGDAVLAADNDDNTGAGGESFVVLCNALTPLRGPGDKGSSAALVECAPPIS